MRYVYSVIRFVPDPARGEFVNVGAIAGSDEAYDWQVRMVDNPKRARQLDTDNALPVMFSYVDRIARELDAFDSAVIGSESITSSVSEDWLHSLADSSLNIVHFSEPAPVSAESAESALDFVFANLVIDPAGRRNTGPTKHTALASLRSSYKHVGLVKGTNFHERLTVAAMPYRESFDFGVANGRVVQLSQTWSFQRGDASIAEDVKAWAWTARELLDRGGTTRIENNGVEMEVPKDVDIDVLYIPPQNGTDSEVLQESLSALHDAGVQAYEIHQSHVVADRARELLIEQGANVNRPLMD